MNAITHKLKTIISVALLLVLAFPLSSASAQRGDITGMRAMQADIAEERDRLRDQAEIMQSYLDEGRIYFVYVPLSGFDAWNMVTTREAVNAWTLEYLQRIERENRPYSSAAFAAFIKARRDTAADIAAWLERTVEQMNARAAKLDRQWKSLEAQIAEMQAPPLPAPPKPPASPPASAPVARAPIPAPADNRDCVEAAGVERLFGLAEAASVAPEAGTHSAAHRGSHDGRPADGTVTWSAPPLTLCVGDEFVIEMNAVNAAPKYESGLSYVASVSVYPTTGSLEIVSCSNPPRGFGPSNNSAAVKSTTSSFTNTCTYRVKSVRLSRSPRGYIAADLSAKPAFGKVTYLYRAR